MPNAPLDKPEAAPANVEAKGPGMVFRAKPRHIKYVAPRTKILKAICMGAGATCASAHTPIGVAIKQPIVSGPKDFQ